jgi:hypothetical protein
MKDVQGLSFEGKSLLLRAYNIFSLGILLQDVYFLTRAQPKKNREHICLIYFFDA